NIAALNETFAVETGCLSNPAGNKTRRSCFFCGGWRGSFWVSAICCVCRDRRIRLQQRSLRRYIAVERIIRDESTSRTRRQRLRAVHRSFPRFLRRPLRIACCSTWPGLSRFVHPVVAIVAAGLLSARR